MKRCAIIGGGISGLAAAYRLSRQAPGVAVTLFEASNRLGGVIRSDEQDGCVIDGGPDSFLTIKRAAIDLSRELGLEKELIGSNDRVRKTFIFSEGTLKTIPEGFFLMVPTSPFPFLKSDLISWAGKFAAMADLFVRPEENDCTVSDFIERRFGSEILNRIAEPMLSGIYGAGISRLSLKNSLPQLWEMQKKGSLLRQLLGKRSAPSPESLFTSLQSGMESMVRSIVARCPHVDWKLGAGVDQIEYTDGFWWVRDEPFDALIVAAPGMPHMSSGSGDRIRKILAGVRRNSALVAVFGFEKTRREGFGWLVPEAERRTVLAATYLNNKFARPNRDNLFLVRVFIGGSKAVLWLDRGDDEILAEARSELHRIAGFDEAPRFQLLYRWKDAMPEYAVDHDARMAEAERLARNEKGLFLTGNLWRGVGVPDCIRHAQKVVDELCRLKEEHHVV